MYSTKLFNLASMGCVDFLRVRRRQNKRLTVCVCLDYKSAVYWIQEQIDSDAVHESDDIRFWVDVVAI
jgi:hypothetical protein